MKIISFQWHFHCEERNVFLNESEVALFGDRDHATNSSDETYVLLSKSLSALIKSGPKYEAVSYSPAFVQLT